MFIAFMGFVYVFLIIYLYFVKKDIALKIGKFKKWKKEYYRDIKKGKVVRLEKIFEDIEGEIINRLIG